MARNDEIRVKFIGDERDLSRATKAIRQEQEELKTGFAQLGDSAKQALSGGMAAGGAAVAVTLDDAKVSAGALEAQIGSLGDRSKVVGGIATEVYRNNFGGSMQEAFQVTGLVTQALGVQGSQLQGLTQDVFTVSDGFAHVGVDAQGLIETLRVMKPAFPGHTEAQLIDLVAGSLQKGTGNAGDLLDTITEYSPVFQHLGLDAADFTHILDTGMANGARNTDVVADAIKELDIRVNTLGDTGQVAIRKMFSPEEAERLIGQFGAGGEAARKAFFTVMEQLSKTGNAQERYNLSVELFGTKAEDMAGSLNPLVDALAQTQGKTRQVHDVTGDMQSQYVGWRNELEIWKRTFQVGVLDNLSAFSGPASAVIEMSTGVGTALFGLSAAGVDVAGALAKVRAAVATTNLAGLAAVAAPLAAALGTVAVAAYGTQRDLRSTAMAAEAAIDPLAGVAANARSLYGVIQENKGLTLSDLAGPESEQRLKRLSDQIGTLTDTSPDLARELLDLAIAEGDVYRSADGAYKGHTLFRDEMILTKDEAAVLDKRVKELARSEKGAGGAAGDAAGQTGALGEAMADTRTEGEKLRDTLDRLAGTTIQAEEAEIDYERALDDARKAIKENGRTTDVHTEKGRVNREAILNVRRALVDHIGALADDGKKMDQLRPVFDRHIDDFRRTLRQAGYTEEEIRKLIRRYGLVPGKVLTDVAVQGKDRAIRDAKDVRGALQGIGDSIASIRGRFHVSVGGSGGITQAKGDIWEHVPERSARGMAPTIMQVPHRIGGEAGAEAYIPLAHDERRPRAIELLRETNKRLGNPLLDMFAQGGIRESMRVRPSIEDIKIKKLLGGPALAWARSQAGKPYVWGGVGPGGYDCSGFMSAIVNVLHGRNPHSRLFATGSIRAGIAGLRSGLGGRFQIGSYRGSPGHMAGTLFGVNVESSGGVGVRVGGGARGARHPMFRQHFYLRRGGIIEGLHGDAPFDLVPQGELDEVMPPVHLPVGKYDRGGYLPPGLSLAYNGLGRPEPVGDRAPVFVQVIVDLDGERLDKRVRVVMDRRDRDELVHATMGV